VPSRSASLGRAIPLARPDAGLTTPDQVGGRLSPRRGEVAAPGAGATQGGQSGFSRVPTREGDLVTDADADDGEGARAGGGAPPLPDGERILSLASKAS